MRDWREFTAERPWWHGLRSVEFRDRIASFDATALFEARCALREEVARLLARAPHDERWRNYAANTGGKLASLDSEIALRGL